MPLAKAPSLASPHCAPHLDTHLDMMSPSFFQCRNSANGNWLLNIIFITLVVESKAGSHVMNYISFFFFFDLYVLLDFSVAQMVKNLPAMQEARVPSLGHQDLLAKGMATIPVFLPGESHGQRSLAGYSPWGRIELNMTEVT